MANEAAMLININYNDYASVQDSMRFVRRTLVRGGKSMDIPFTYDGMSFVLSYVHGDEETNKFTVYNAPGKNGQPYERMDRETDDITHRMRMHILKLPQVQSILGL